MDTQDIVETWHQEAIAEGRAQDVLTVLRVRGLAVSTAARKRILTEKDPQRLERWLEKAILATSLGEVLDDRAPEPSSKAGKPAARKERSRRRSARVAVQR